MARGVKCPVCAQLHPIGHPDITQLPPNVALFEILQTRRGDCQDTVSQQPLCDVCHEQPTTMVCIDCQPGFHYRFCEKCDKLEHERNFGPVKRHRRYQANQVPALMTFVPCNRHGDRRAVYYSESRKEFACNACEVQSDWIFRSEHFELIPECAKKVRASVQRLYQTGGNIIGRLAASKVNIDAILKQLGPSASTAKANISSQFAEIISRIQSRQQKLLNQVDKEVLCVCVCSLCVWEQLLLSGFSVSSDVSTSCTKACPCMYRCTCIDYQEVGIPDISIVSMNVAYYCVPNKECGMHCKALCINSLDK